jgi:ComF family protein
MMTNLQVRTARTRGSLLSGWLQRGLDLLFPPRCVACSKMGSWLCAACQSSIELVSPPICSRCGQSLLQSAQADHGGGELFSTEGLCARCRIEPIQLDGIRSVAIHGGALRRAIHHLKYRHRHELAATLGQMLFVYWQKVDLPAELVVPVPLHASRRKKRGYNQAALLARVLAEHAFLALNETHLVRTRATPPQVGLGARERKTNVQDAFAWAGPRLDGIGVLLVDDVCTTGATLEACALALRRAGAESVWALTLARAH